MICNGKHTKTNIPTEDFNCPNCGQKAGNFYIHESGIDADPDCLLLHKDDSLFCSECELNISGQKFWTKWQEEGNIEVCPCCKGRGFVSKKLQ